MDKIAKQMIAEAIKLIKKACFFICFIGLFDFLSAAENLGSKKYKLSICTLFKNEGHYLREWIEYHQVIGVDHFYLYDNGSLDRSIEVISPYIKDGKVTLIQWPDRVLPTNENDVSSWVLSTQLPAYENAIKSVALNETEWIVFLDVDEYLVPIQANTITEILDRYEDCSGLQIVSDFFDSSCVGILPKRDLLIATVELIGTPVQNVQKCIEKTIFKPDFQKSFTWPPYRCEFKENKLAVKINSNEVRINKYVNRHKGDIIFGKLRKKLHVDSRMLTYNEKRELLEIGFEIEDKERAIYRFAPQLRKRMGMEQAWEW